MRAKVGIRTLNHMGLTYNFLTDWWFRIGLRLQFFFFNHIFWVLFCNFLLPCWSFQTFRSLVSHARCGEAIEASSKGILEKEAQIKTAEDIDPWKLEPKWVRKGSEIHRYHSRLEMMTWMGLCCKSFLVYTLHDLRPSGKWHFFLLLTKCSIAPGLLQD